MTKLFNKPTQSGYGASISSPLSVKLSGPASSYAKDVERNVHSVSATWELDGYGFDYFMAFYRNVTKYASLPFECDLVLENEDVEEYTVKIVPGSLKLSEVRGNKRIVSADLEVKRL